MAHGKELIEVETNEGLTVKITLSEWAENIIDRALAKHKVECPMEKYKEERVLDIRSLDRRIAALELKLKITHWLTAPFYLGLVVWLMKTFTNVL